MRSFKLHLTYSIYLFQNLDLTCPLLFQQALSKPLFIREQDNSSYVTNQFENSSLQEVFKTGYGGRNPGTGLENEVAFTKIKIRYEIFARFGFK